MDEHDEDDDDDDDDEEDWTDANSRVCKSDIDASYAPTRLSTDGEFFCSIWALEHPSGSVYIRSEIYTPGRQHVLHASWVDFCCAVQVQFGFSSFIASPIIPNNDTLLICMRNLNLFEFIVFIQFSQPFPARPSPNAL